MEKHTRNEEWRKHGQESGKNWESGNNEGNRAHGLIKKGDTWVQTQRWRIEEDAILTGTEEEKGAQGRGRKKMR